ncbi:MAG TPA: hypothetical protein VKB09_17080 [Thermomicrobiales bacterium]|nr:hypothetical protein [Thermomicrobiales bacterium]
MTAVALKVSPPIETIERLFDVDDRDDIRDFLAARPHLVSVLREASERIPGSFPPGTKASLDLVHHPEPGSRPKLVLRIQTPLPMTEALARLDRLDEEWWLDVLPLARGEMTLVVWPA